VRLALAGETEVRRLSFDLPARRLMVWHEGDAATLDSACAEAAGTRDAGYAPPASAASTIPRASCWICARCSFPLKLSAYSL